jgi:hypothetical protein
LHKKARARYATKTPPGYADKDKGEPDAFGDFIGWTQIMEIAKQEKKSMVLLTDDGKEDWWQIQGDRTIGPRPELVAEFRTECDQHFYMYSSGRFMELAKDYLQQQIGQSAIEEVKEKRIQERLQSSSDLKPVSSPGVSGGGEEKVYAPPIEVVAEDLKADSLPKANRKLEGGGEKMPTS